jgi:hypothetical protein
MRKLRRIIEGCGLGADARFLLVMPMTGRQLGIVLRLAGDRGAIRQALRVGESERNGAEGCEFEQYGH